MERLRKKLIRDRARFNRKVRRVLLVALVSLLCVAALLIYLRASVAPQAERTTLRAPQASGRAAPVLVLPEPVQADPSQLIPRAELYFARDVNPVRTIGEKARKISVIDRGLLFKVLKVLEGIPQEELVRRADRAIRWEDFNDPQRREQIRGRACIFEGTLRRIAPVRDIDLAEIGLENLYEGQIQDVYGRWYSFYCFEKPRREIKRTDVAVLAGVFYKLIKYPTRRGEEMITPLIVSRTIAARAGPVVPRPFTARIIESAPPWLLWLIAVTVLLALGFLILVRRPGALLKKRPPLRVPDDLDNIQIRFPGEEEHQQTADKTPDGQGNAE